MNGVGTFISISDFETMLPGGILLGNGQDGTDPVEISYQLASADIGSGFGFDYVRAGSPGRPASTVPLPGGLPLMLSSLLLILCGEFWRRRPNSGGERGTAANLC
jgi:hypothetical protein